MKALRMIVHGTVQGVGFRYHTLQQAQKLQILGYVRNLANGTVEILAEGPEKDLQTLLAWAKKGPQSARVTEVVCEDHSPQGQLTTFEIRS